MKTYWFDIIVLKDRLYLEYKKMKLDISMQIKHISFLPENTNHWYNLMTNLKDAEGAVFFQSVK